MKKLCFLLVVTLGYTTYSYGQISSKSVEIRTDWIYSAQDCEGFFGGAEEWTAYVYGSWSGGGGDSGCQTRSGSGYYGYNSNIGIFSTYSNYFDTYLRVWEDDTGNRCSYSSSGDDCLFTSQYNRVEFMDNVPSSFYYNRSYYYFYHDYRILYKWNYQSAGNALTPTACTDYDLTLPSYQINAYTVNLVANQSYTFETISGGDTYLRLYSSNGYSFVAQDDNSGTGSLSKITYTASSSGLYFIEVYNGYRDPVSSNTVLRINKSEIPENITSTFPSNNATDVCYAGEAAITQLGWNSVSGATSYDLYFGANSLPANSINLTTNSYTLPSALSANTPYYMQVVPRNACGAATGTITRTFTTASTPCDWDYCYVTFNNVRPITLVSFGSINNASSASTSSSSYEDFTGLSTTVLRNNLYTLAVKGNTNGSQLDRTLYFSAYFDWNHDGDFNDSGEYYQVGSITNSTGAASSTAITKDIVIPSNAVLTNTTMRIIASRFGYYTDPCAPTNNQGSNYYGQTEDYTINICDAPVAVCQDVTIELDASGNANLTVNDVDDGSTANCGLQSIALSQTSFSCADIGPNPVTLTITDRAGNQDSCTVTVIVEDNTLPDISCSNITVSTEGSCNATINIAPPLVSDNCNSGNGLNFDGVDDFVSIGAVGIARTIEFWMYTDTEINGNGNYDMLFNFNNSDLLYIATNHVTSSIVGETLSIVTAGGILSIKEVLPAGWNHIAISSNAINYNSIYLNGASITTFTSGVSANIIDINSGFFGQRPSSPQNRFEGALDEVRFWDVAKSASEIQHNMNRELNSQPGLIGLYNLNEGIANTDNNGITTATDTSINQNNGTLNNFALTGCNSNWVTGFNGIILFNDYTNSCNASGVYPVGDTVITWTAIDAAGNPNTCTQTITVEDNDGPTMSCKNVTVQLDANGNASISAQNLELANSSADFSGTQGQDGWTYGQYFAFVPQDWQLPNWTGFVWADNQSFATPFLDANGGHPGVDDLKWAVRRWTSNYTGEVLISGDFFDRNGSCGDGAHVRIFKNGNQEFEYLNIPTSSQSYSFTLNISSGDYLDFVIDPKFDAGCDDTHFTAIISSTNGIDNGSSDVCGIANYSLDITNFTCDDIGPNTVTLTVTDVNNNESTCTATVTVEDNIAPTLSQNTGIVDFLSNCQVSIPDVTQYVSDNCSTVFTQVPAVSTPIDAADGDTIMVTIYDEAGNEIDFTLTVDDSTPPVLTQNSIDIDFVGNCEVEIPDLLAYASDNCPPLSQNPPAGSLVSSTHGGSITVAISDASGNSVPFTLNVNDITDPAIDCPADIDDVIATSASGAVVFYTAPIGTDNCTSTTELIAGYASGETFPLDETIVTYRVTDGANNSVDCSFTVTVIGVAPNIVCPGPIIVNNDIDQCGAVVTFEATDTAGIPESTITYSHDPGTVFPVGTTTVTATATNAIGTDTCTFTVTVNDTEDPVAICPADITVSNNAGDCGAVVAFELSATDNCSTFGGGAPSAPLVITAIFDGPLTGGVPKGVELYAVEDIVDLSIFGLGSANNGGGTDGEEFTFPTGALAAGSYIYVASESPGFTSFFGFAPDYTSAAMAINGDDAIELFQNGSVIDTFGTLTGGNSGWNYTDGWAYRNDNTGPDGIVFISANWTFSGADALDGETSNGTATTPVPIGTYSNASGGPAGTVASVPASGSFFAVGTTQVTVTATDAAGNTNVCYFDVTVNDTEDPVAICPADITVDNDLGQCSAVVTFNTSFTDNCTGGNVVASPASGSTFDVGTTQVTVTATDAAGNTNVCYFDVTVNDTENPVAICPTDIIVENDLGQCSAVVTFNTSFTDNCAGGNVVASPASGSTFDVGTTQVTVTATDAAGNINVCYFDVTVNDTEDPVAICPADITVSNNAGDCGAVVAFELSATDNCSTFGGGAPSAPLVITAIFDGPLTGGVPKGVELYAVEDIVDLSIFGLGSANNGGGTDGEEFTFPTGALAAGSYIYVASESPGFTSFFGFAPDYTSAAMAINGDDAIELFQNGSVIDTFGTLTGGNSGWNYTDGWAYRNDNTGPDGIVFISANWTFSGADALDGETSNGTATTPVPIGTYSNASGGPAGTVASVPASGSFFAVGTTQVTVTATDAAGNTNVCYFDVTVNDTEDPVAICPADITVDNDLGQCSAVVTFNTSFTDNCTGGNVVASPASGSTFDVGTTQVTVTATDAAGNTNVCYFDVTVNDTENPVAICPTDIIVENDLGQCSAVVTFNTSFTDNCAGGNVVASPASGSTFDVGTTQVTVTATDAAGNTNVCYFDVTVNDTEDPVAICPTDITVDNVPGDCSAIVTFNTSFTDNCAGGSVIASPASGSTFDEGTTQVTVTATDAAGNTNVCYFDITVNDTENPTIQCGAALNVYLSNLSSLTITPDQLVGFVDDNCDVASVTISQDTFNCEDVNGDLANLIISEYVDGPGIENYIELYNGTGVTVDLSEYKLVVFYNDKPTEEYQLGGTVDSTSPINGVAFATVISHPQATYAGVLSNNVQPLTFDGDDAIALMHNNVIIDRLNVFSSGVSLDGTTLIRKPDVNAGNLSTSAGADEWIQIDNAPTDDLLQHAVEITTNVNNVEVIVTDTSGNTSTCIANVIVNDDIPPIAICKAATVMLDDSGNGILTPDQVDDGSYDECSSIKSLTLDRTEFSCADVGQSITVTLTVEDTYGNTSSCTASITVEDNVAPTVATQSHTVQLDASGIGSITVNDIDAGSTDACGIASMSVAPNSFTCSNVGENTVTLTVIDVNGNSASATATVWVEDNVAPNALCNAISVTLDATGGYTLSEIDIEAIADGSSDACGIAILSVSPDSYTCSDVGTNVPVTLMITDVNGNMSSCDTTVLVNGTIPSVTITQSELPEFCQGDVVVLTANSDDAVSYEWSTGDTTQSIEVGSDATYSVTVTSDTNCIATASHMVSGFDLGVLISSYTILANDEVYLHGNNLVQTGAVGVTSGNGLIKLHQASNIVGRGQAVNFNFNQGSTVGTQINQPANPTIPAFVFNTQSTNSSPDVTVNNNNSQTLDGTEYDEITIKQGATVTFTQPNVYINEIKTFENATILFSGCTNVYLNEKFMLARGGNINATGVGRNVVFYVNDDVQIEQGSNVRARIHLNGNEILAKGANSTGNGSGNNAAEPTYMTGLFIANRVHGNKNVIWNADTLCDPCPSIASPPVANPGGYRVNGFDIKSWPNPSDTDFNIKLITENLSDKAVIKIFDMNNKLIYISEFGPTETYRFGKELPGGVYVIKVMQGNDSATERLIKY